MSGPKKYHELVHESKDKDYYTPEYALEYVKDWLMDYKDKKVWECCCGKGHITRWLQKQGFTDIIQTDLKETGHDFYTYEPDEYDVIITNPPFKNKRMFIERCLSLKKPTFILLPTMTLESNTIRPSLKPLGKDFGIILPPKSIHYIPSEVWEKNPEKTDKLTLRESRTFFHSSWFTFFIPSSSGIQLL
jgi:hypothetical protein